MRGAFASRAPHADLREMRVQLKGRARSNVAPVVLGTI
jgi:hypothetical protein